MSWKELSQVYQKSHESPHKRFSYFPTMMHLLSPIEGKITLDLGCGDGFLTKPIAERHSPRVYGIDNEPEQLMKASRLNPHLIIDYILVDVFRDPLPQASLVSAPFLLNYAPNIETLEFFFKSAFSSMQRYGSKIVTLWDTPREVSERKFFGDPKYGYTNEILGNVADESPIEVSLFTGGDESHLIDTFEAYYFTPSTIERMMREAGFEKIQWHDPMVSQEGINELGESFWEGFVENSGLSYVTAVKI